MSNRGRTHNDGGRYSTPRGLGRGRGRGRSSSRSDSSFRAYHQGPAGRDGPSSNVYSGHKYERSHLEWRPTERFAMGSVANQVDCTATSKSTYQQNCNIPGTKDDISSDLGKLELVENSPEAMTPETEEVCCLPVSVSASKQVDCTATSKSPYQQNCNIPGTKDYISSDLGKLELVENSPEAMTPETKEVCCMSVSVSASKQVEKGFSSISAQSDLRAKDLNVGRSQKCKILDEEEESGSYLRFDHSPALDNSHMVNEQTPHKKAVDDVRSDISDYVSVGVPFDICPVRAGNMVELKAPLHVQNRTKRNEAKRSVEGKSIIVLRPGMILLKSYLSLMDQVEIIKKCRDLGLGCGGFYEPGYREGGKLHLKMMCLGKNWDPETSMYGDRRPNDGAKPPLIPVGFCQLVKEAIQASHSFVREQQKVPNAEHVLPSVSPNICIVNFYSKSGRLGLHQDKDESTESLNKGLPVVSFSIGDTAEFLYNDQRDIENAQKIRLESGDVLIFGGKSRRIFHGVTAIDPGTAPRTLLDETHMLQGRLNLTFREF